MTKSDGANYCDGCRYQYKSTDLLDGCCLYILVESRQRPYPGGDGCTAKREGVWVDQRENIAYSSRGRNYSRRAKLEKEKHNGK